MREMKYSGVPWIGIIPIGWRTCRFKFLNGGTNVGESIDKDYWSNNQSDMIFYTAGADPIHTSYSQFPTWKYTSKYDILLARNGTPYVYLPVNNALYTDHIIRAKIKDGADKRFLRYCLMQSIKAEIVDSVSLATWSASLWNEQSLPLPTLSEQQRIADFLDRKCTDIDNVIEKTKASIEEYKKLKQSVITDAVTKGVRGPRPMKDSGIEWIDSYPKDWTLTKVKWLLKERNERSEDGSEEPLSMSQKYGLIPTKEMDTIPNMASTFVGAKITHKGDLVFNKLKAHLGVFAVSDYYGLVSPDYAVYFKTDRAIMRYLEYLFKTPQYILEFRKRSSGVGAGLTRLYTGDLFAMYTASPSLDEQQEIAEYLDKKCSEIDSLIASKEKFITELESYKNSLIYEYVTGKKEVPVEA